MSDGVLPLGELLFVVGESLLYKLTDPTESQPLVRSLEDCHGDHRYVGVGRLHSLGLLVLLVLLLALLIVLLVVLLDLVITEPLRLEVQQVLTEESVHLDYSAATTSPQPASAGWLPEIPLSVSLSPGRHLATVHWLTSLPLTFYWTTNWWFYLVGSQSVVFS